MAAQASTLGIVYSFNELFYRSDPRYRMLLAAVVDRTAEMHRQAREAQNG